MCIKKVILILLCLLPGYFGRAECAVQEEGFALVDNTELSDCRFEYDRGFEPAVPQLQQTNKSQHKRHHKSKFRPPSSFIDVLYPPVVYRDANEYVIAGPQPKYRKYWLSPSYIVFLFRYTPF